MKNNFNRTIVDTSYFDIEGNHVNRFDLKFADFSEITIRDMTVGDSRRFKAVHSYHDVHGGMHDLYEEPFDDYKYENPYDGKVRTGETYKIKRLTKYLVLIIREN
jgi:hypothetical protein